jgi:hypothetical protein
VPLSRRHFLQSAFSPFLPQEARFSADVKVVTLFATARDRKGRIVRDLSKEDFQLEEDGSPQTIRYFSRESDLPVKIGILIDTSRSQYGILEHECRASYTFLDRMLREGKDSAFVMKFDVAVTMLQGFTSSRTLVYSILYFDPRGYMRARRDRSSLPLPVARRGRPTLQRLSGETGGTSFLVSQRQAVEQVFDRIQDELRNQYSMGYTPDRRDAGRGYRRIRLTVRNKSVTVQARDGFTRSEGGRGNPVRPDSGPIDFDPHAPPVVPSDPPVAGGFALAQPA